MIEVALDRTRWSPHDTPGRLSVDGAFVCYSLEDPVLEIPGRPLEQWKVPGRCATQSGRFPLVLEDSPKYGADCLTIVVPGWVGVRIHCGNDEDDTEGCPLTGLRLEADLELGGTRIVGGTSRPALERLRELVVPRLKAKVPGWITITNPAEWYANYREAA